MDKHFKELVDSAFDFLKEAVTQLEEKPKYSVIHFCVAIELFLKARLMKEHWALIVADKVPCKEKFEAGDFVSINFKDILPKIEAITGEEISSEIKKNFDKLAKHRNQAIHFYHDKINQIATEQYLGWHYLHELLSGWGDIFSDYTKYKEKINDINLFILKKYNKYIDEVFKNIQKQIKEETAKGIKFEECEVCKKKAFGETLKEDKLTPNPEFEECRVCHYRIITHMIIMSSKDPVRKKGMGLLHE